MIGKDQNLTNAILGRDRYTCLTKGQLIRLLAGVPNETMVAIDTGVNIGSIFCAEINQLRPVRQKINPNDPMSGDYWEFKQTLKSRDGTDVVILVASTLPEKEDEDDEVPNLASPEHEEADPFRLL